jgi:hypothetical protein
VFVSKGFLAARLETYYCLTWLERVDVANWGLLEFYTRKPLLLVEAALLLPPPPIIIMFEYLGTY